MGRLAVGSLTDYRTTLQRLLPQGEFWDRQLADASSDVSRFLEARAAGLVRLKGRMATLIDESTISSATETLDDWERVAEVDNRTLDTELRRSALLQRKLPSVNLEQMQKTAEVYGAAILSLEAPYSPAFFGTSRFNARLASPAAWNVLYLTISIADTSLKTVCEAALTGILLANQIPYFSYKDA